MARKPEAEIFAEATAQAQDALKALPVAETYLTGSHEEDAHRAETEAAAETQAADQESDATDRARILRLEQVLAAQTALIRDLAKNLGTGQLVDPQGEPVRAQPAPPTEAELQQTVRIFLVPTGDPAQDRPQPVSVNGQTWMVPRGTITTVPRFVLGVLQDAVVDSHEYPIEDGQYRGVRRPGDPLMTPSLAVHRRVPRFQVIVYDQ